MPKRLLFVFLLLSFACYSIFVYTNGTQLSDTSGTMTKLADKGKMIWQKNNCTACHQLFGLGGYLGPDLTNVISAKGKGPDYVKAFMFAGVGAMPRFEFTKDEQNALVEFLTYVDKSGKFPNRDVQKTWYGSFKIKKMQ